MAGLATIAKQQGYTISGSDQQFYPPMGTAVKALTDNLFSGYNDTCQNRPADLYIIGNVISRGNPLMESILRTRAPFISGPQWLYQKILHNKTTIAVAGTHGKTTTTTLLTYLLDQYGFAPNFLIGGFAPNFGTSARLSPHSDLFVIEADEYDTAYFDKRPKFLHYHPQIAIINNIEFDHADIYSDIEQINQQFHYLCRTIPDNGAIIAPAQDGNIKKVLAQGHYSPVHCLNHRQHWHWQWDKTQQQLTIFNGTNKRSECRPPFIGDINRDNLLACVAVLDQLGADLTQLNDKLHGYLPPQRRLQHVFTHNNIQFWDDFAHHPTAIQKTIAALREHQPDRRLIAVFEPRSNSMKSGYFAEQLPTALQDADIIIATSNDGWLQQALAPCPQPTFIATTALQTIAHISAHAQPCDNVLIMSNGSYDNLLHHLKKQYSISDNNQITENSSSW